MGRMVYVMMSIVAINLALLLFTCTSYTSTGDCVPQSTIWTYVFSPSEITTSNFWDILFGTGVGLAAIAGSLLIVGSFLFKSDTPLFLGMTLSLAPLITSWIKLYQNLEGSAFFAGRPMERTIVAIMIVSPILIAYIFTIIDWARGRD